MGGKIVVTEKSLEHIQTERIKETAGRLGYTAEFYASPDEAEAAGALAEAEILYGGGLAPYIGKAPKLKWICSSWAGVEPYCKAGVMPDEMLLTNASGAFGVTIAEYGVMVTLMLMRGQVAYNRVMTTREWMSPMPQRTLKDSRVTCLGAGDIGQTFAKRIRGFEPRSITAVNRTGRTAADCFDAVYPQSRLKEVLKETDLLFMSLPGTPATANIINRETLACLPKHAYIVNVGRGAAIDEEALIEALNEERIAGAAVDVMKTEPLPEDDPLWSAKHILITPHIAGNLTTDDTRDKNAGMFCEDLVNYAKGLPLKYAVDRTAGY